MSKHENVDSYIAEADKETRPKLEELRKIIRSATPSAEEGMLYGVPFYKYHGELAGFAALKNHVSLGFGAAGLPSKDRKMFEEKGYETGRATLLIKLDQKVPTAAITQVLRARAKTNEDKRKALLGQ